jgi:hypothetical protein
MIKINLLPPELQAKKARAVSAPGGPMAGNILVIGVTVILLTIVSVAGGMMYTTVNRARNAQAMAEGVLQVKKATYNRMKTQYQDRMVKWNRMKNQEEVLDVLMPDDRLLWSEKMHMLSAAMPVGVFVTGIKVTEESKLVETKYSLERRKDWEEQMAKAEQIAEPAKKDSAKKALGTQPEAIQKPIITQTFVLDAIATGNDGNDRFDKMLELEKSLQSYTTVNAKGVARRFMDHFLPEIEFGSMESDEVDGVAVWRFQFLLKTKSFGFDEG